MKNIFRLLTVIFILIDFVGLSQFSSAQSTRSIEIRGIPPNLTPEIKQKFGSALATGSLKEIDDLIRYLYSTGLFENIELNKMPGAEHRLSLTAFPVKKIDGVTVTGHRFFSRSEIVATLGARKGQILNRQGLQDGAEVLRDRYGEAGYLNAKISVDFVITSSGNYDVVVKIDEGRTSTFEKIEIATVNLELQKEIQKLATKFVGRAYRQTLAEELESNIRQYLIENRYLSATLGTPNYKFNADRTSVSIQFQIDKPFRYVLLFEGNQALSTADLLSELNLSTRQNFGPNPALDISSKIEFLYRSKGYSTVKVTPDERKLENPFSRRVEFQIHEGERTAIKEIQIAGNFSRPMSYYIDLFNSKALNQISHGFFVKEDLDLSIAAFILELQNQGYLRAKVLATRVDYIPNKSGVTFLIQLEEGFLTKIKTIAIRGNTVPKDELMALILLQPGSPLRILGLEESIEALKNYYLTRGYLDAFIENEKEGLVSYNESGSEASISFQIHEGPIVTVGSIAIDGTQLTKDEVVTKELEFSVGELLTPEKIRDSQYRLQRLGIFNQVDITTLEAGTPSSSRTVLVRISERDPGLFASGLGISNEFDLTLRGYLGFSYSNISGTARGFSTRLEVKRVNQIEFIDSQVSASYFEPFLFNTRTRGRANLSRSRSILSRLNNSIPAEEKDSFELSTEREFSRHLKTTFSAWRIEFIRNLDIFGGVEKATTPDQTIASIGPTVELDYRDNPFVPKTGTYTRFNVEYADPTLGSSPTVRYVRATGGFNFYLPFFSKRLVVAQSIRGGYVSNLMDGQVLPPSKKFFLGGRSTIHGYDPGSIPIGDLSQPDKQSAVTTDSHFYLFKSELRFPLFGDFEGVIFYDGGAVKITGYSFDPAYREGAGAGLRYVTPVGPANFEFGWRLNRQTGEPEGRFDFSIGTF